MWRFVLLVFGVSAVFTQIGCDVGVPVSKVTKVSFRVASDQPVDDFEILRVYGTERDVYVSRNTLLTNQDISTVERFVDSNGSPRVILNFTPDGANKMSAFTKDQKQLMLALMIDGHLMTALPIRAEIRNSAEISGGMSQVDADRVFVMLTAKEAKRREH